MTGQDKKPLPESQVAGPISDAGRGGAGRQRCERVAGMVVG